MFIVFRTDSSSKIGSGHVKRCLNLARSLKKKGNKILFISQKFDGNFINEIRKNNFNIKVIKNKFNFFDKKVLSNHFNAWSKSMQKNDIDILKKKIKEKIDWIIIDHYGLNQVWEKMAYKVTKKIFVIDDLKINKHYCDLYLNYHHNFFKSADKKILIKKKTKILKGLNYTLLGNEFNSNKKNRDRSKIFLYMGSVDKNNITLKILKLFNDKLFINYKIIVLIGSNNPQRTLIKKYVKKNNHIKILKKNNINLKKIYDHVNYVISASGVTMYEQLKYGFKPIIFPQNKFQLKISQSLKKSNLINTINVKNRKAKQIFFRILQNNKNFFDKSTKICINKFVFNGSEKIANVINQSK